MKRCGYLILIILLLSASCALTQTRMRYSNITTRVARNAEGLPGVYIAIGYGVSQAAAMRDATTNAARITEVLGWRFFVINNDPRTFGGQAQFTFSIVTERTENAVDATQWLDRWTGTSLPSDD